MKARSRLGCLRAERAQGPGCPITAGWDSGAMGVAAPIRARACGESRAWSWSHQREQKLLQPGASWSSWPGAPTRAGAPATHWFPVGIFPDPQVKHEQMLFFEQGFLPPSVKRFCCNLPSQTGQPFRERNATCKTRRKKSNK